MQLGSYAVVAEMQIAPAGAVQQVHPRLLVSTQPATGRGDEALRRTAQS